MKLWSINTSTDGEVFKMAELQLIGTLLSTNYASEGS